MARLIRTDALLKRIDRYHPDIRDIVKKELRYVPTVKAEPTEKQVEEYCHKRCLVVVDSELFNEMKARWSEEPVKHGHWVFHEVWEGTNWGFYECSICGDRRWTVGGKYCQECGTKMDEVIE